MNILLHHYIEHEGLVKDVHDGKAKVTLINQQGCASCSVKRSCGFSETGSERALDIDCDKALAVGDHVLVRISKEAGVSAVVLSYFIPLLLVMTVLVVLTHLQVQEEIAGIAALLVLAPYYGIVSWAKTSLSKILHMEVIKK